MASQKCNIDVTNVYAIIQLLTNIVHISKIFFFSLQLILTPAAKEVSLVITDGLSLLPGT